MNTPDAELLSLLEYRMNAIAIGHLALKYTRKWDHAPSIDIRFDGVQVIEGKATAFTNGAIEAAILHCRALLEFLGLKGKDKTTLNEITGKRMKDDAGVEHFPGLSKLSIQKAVETYPGPKEEAESALAYVIYVANKGLAHTTSSFTKHDQGSALLEIAFRGVPILLINSFYVPLQIKRPQFELQSRLRET